MDEIKNIDELLKQLPAEKTSVDFTARLMMQVEALPPRQQRLSAGAIIALSLGGLVALAGGWWAADYFFGWTALYVQPFLHATGQLLSSIIGSLTRVRYSPSIIGGMLAGALLLLVDARLHKRIGRHQEG